MWVWATFLYKLTLFHRISLCLLLQWENSFSIICFCRLYTCKLTSRILKEDHELCRKQLVWSCLCIVLIAVSNNWFVLERVGCTISSKSIAVNDNCAFFISQDLNPDFPSASPSFGTVCFSFLSSALCRSTEYLAVFYCTDWRVQEKVKKGPIQSFLYYPCSIFYILPSNPRLTILFLMSMIPGFTNLLDRRSSASWLSLPLSCSILAGVVNISFTLGCQWTKSFLQVPFHTLTLSLFWLKWLSRCCHI